MQHSTLTLILISIITFALNAQRNVILIIADDLGTDYCGFYENHKDTVAMPNIRMLLSSGIRFKNAWSNPLCSPTRAGALTGRYSFRTGVGDAVGGAGSAVLDTSELTIPKLLNKFAPNGIAKAHIGKWHLHLDKPTTNYIFPNKMGYDHFEGNFTGVLADYYNWTKVTNGVANKITNYATTETVDNAITWIKSQRNKPFFIWLAFNAPHTPYHLPPSTLHSDTTLSGTANDIAANPKSYFKASLEALDHETGRLFDTLKSLQKWDSTDFIFIGDNGDDPNVAQNSGSAKGSIYQEGVNVPFIISGPSVVNPNRSSDALVNTHDLFATILELFGFSNWQTEIPFNKQVDSKSIFPILRNEVIDIRPWIFTEVFKNPTVGGDGKAMRNKNYKLLDFDNGTQKFFNLTADPIENNNLLARILSTDEYSNYNYLCNEMTILLGDNRFCSIPSNTNEEKTSKFFLVHPNPFNSFITINPLHGNEVFYIYNSIGNLIFNGNKIANYNFSTLNKGIYFLKIIGEKTEIIKLVKE